MLLILLGLCVWIRSGIRHWTISVAGWLLLAGVLFEPVPRFLYLNSFRVLCSWFDFILQWVINGVRCIRFRLYNKLH